MLPYAFQALAVIFGLLLFTRWTIVLLGIYYCVFAILTVVVPETLAEAEQFKVYRLLYVFLVISCARRILFPTRKTRFRFEKLPIMSYTALVSVMLLAAIYAPPLSDFGEGHSHSLVGRLVVMALFLLAATQLQRPSDVRIFSGATILCSLVLSVWVISVAGGSDFSTYRAGVEVNPNYISTFVMIGLISLIEVFFRGSQYWLRTFSAAVFLVQVYALLLLASRSTWVAGVVAAISMFIWHARVTTFRRIVALALMGLVLIAGIIYLPGGEGLVKRFTEEDVYSLNLRMVVWRISLNRIAERDLKELVFGEGMNSSVALIYRFSVLGAAHNMYLTWLLEEGFLGFLLFSWFLFFIGKTLLRSSHRWTTILIGWYTYLVVIGLASDMSNRHVFWILLGVAAGAGALVKKSAHRGKDAMGARYHAGVTLPNMA